MCGYFMDRKSSHHFKNDFVGNLLSPDGSLGGHAIFQVEYAITFILY